MNLDNKIIDYILFDLNKKSKPLEESIKNSELQINSEITDSAQLIREFLVSKDLLKHNPRLTFVDAKTPISKGVSIVQDEIADEFKNDHLTDKGIRFVNESSFSQPGLSISKLIDKK